MHEFSYSRHFEALWNIPSEACAKHGITFNHISNKYGIIQNSNDRFRGQNITILYDPGRFPALLKDKSGDLFYRNGGVPQEGNITEHLEIFRTHIDQIIPDRNFSGYGVIDFESWRPIFRQNFGDLVIYKNVSFAIEKNRHFYWPKKWIEAEVNIFFFYYCNLILTIKYTMVLYYRHEKDGKPPDIHMLRRH